MIDLFFDSLSFQPTTINYVSTTSHLGATTYTDDNDPNLIDVNTKLLAIPITVVASTESPTPAGRAG